MKDLIKELIPYLPEIFRWIFFTAIPATAVFFWRAYVSHRNERQKKESLRSFIQGLPPEAYEILIAFKDAGSHTIILEPYHPITLYLKNLGFIQHVGSAGGYDAASGLFMLRGDIYAEVCSGLPHPSGEGSKKED
jgi:hypothetical protein